MIIEDMANLITELRKRQSAREIAKIFNKERKWVYAIENGCTFRLDYNLIIGLNELGYEIKLQKRSDK